MNQLVAAEITQAQKHLEAARHSYVRELKEEVPAHIVSALDCLDRLHAMLV